MHGRELVAQSLFPVGKCGGEFAAYLRKQYDQFSLVIREANIRQNDR
jgi:tripartite-type tricarboxylate transporter receptor subunit TctC